MKKIILCLLCAYATHTHAELSFDIQPIDLKLQLRTDIQLKTDSQFTASERRTLQSIQPLMQAKDYASVWQTITSHPSPNSSPAWLHFSAQIALALDKQKSAKRKLEQALKQMPHFIRAHREMAFLLIKQERLQDAQKHLIKSIELGDQHAQSYGMLGYLHSQQGHYPQAVAAYQQAQLLEPQQMNWQQGLLQSYLSMAAYPQAKALLDELQARKANDVELWRLRAYLEMKQNEPSAALASLEIAYRIQPLANIAWQLAQLYFQQEHFALATRYFLLSNHDIVEHRDHYVAAIEYLVQTDQLTLASQMLAKLNLDNAPSQPSHQSAIHFVKGLFARANNQKGAAESQFQHAIALNPLHTGALVQLAGMAIDNKHYLKADQLLQRAQHTTSQTIEILNQRAYVAIIQSQYHQARELLQQILKQSPHHPQAQEQLTFVQSMLHSLNQN